MVKRKNHSCILALILIGTSVFCLNLRSETQDEGLAKFQSDGLVEVDALYVEPTLKNTNYTLMDYKNRRQESGVTFTIAKTLFEPAFYQPKFSIDTFQTVYGEKEGTGVDVSFGQKNNLSIFSYTYEFGVNIYNVASLESATDVSDLKLISLLAGIKITLDTIFDEPYVVPFISAGGYLTRFEEVQNGNPTYSGNTQPAGYYAGGLLIQLDWVDRYMSRQAYEESGLENTFIFVEGRKFLASSNGVDPDLESEVHLSAGLQLEF